jgi:hypothetical protein
MTVEHQRGFDTVNGGHQEFWDSAVLALRILKYCPPQALGVWGKPKKHRIKTKGV